jgi:hypothetical protein
VETETKHKKAIISWHSETFFTNTFMWFNFTLHWVKLRGMRMVKHVACNMHSTDGKGYKILVRKPQGDDHLGGIQVDEKI